jgi:hypothetical protein
MSNNKLEFPKDTYLTLVLAILGMPWGFIIFKLFGRAEEPLKLFEFMLYCALGTMINFLVLVLLCRFFY